MPPTFGILIIKFGLNSEIILMFPHKKRFVSFFTVIIFIFKTRFFRELHKLLLQKLKLIKCILIIAI